MRRKSVDELEGIQDINGLTEKGTPIAADLVVIEDSAAGYARKKAQIGNLPGGAGTDADAIHDNVAGEIAAVTEKAVPISTDLLLIEDSAAANVKKRVQIGNLPAGGGVTLLTKTITSASLATGAKDQQNVTSMPNQAVIVWAGIKLSSGAATSVKVIFYQRDTFDTDVTGPFGGAWPTTPMFGGISAGESLVGSAWSFGPHVDVSGNSIYGPISVYDRDGTSEWHIEFENSDFSDPGNSVFELRVLYYDATALTLP